MLFTLQEYASELNTQNLMVGDLNEKARQLERRAGSQSREAIERMMSNINDRWTKLNTQAEDKQRAAEVKKQLIWVSLMQYLSFKVLVQ